MRQANEVDAVADFFSVAGEQSASANESDASENEVSFEIADAFKISLSSAALSSSAELRSEAIVLLSKLPWQELCGMKTPAASGGGVHTSLLSSIIEKMDLGTDRGMPSVGCPPILTGTCRAMESLGRCKVMNARRGIVQQRQRQVRGGRI